MREQISAFEAARFAVMCDGAVGNSNTHAAHTYKPSASPLSWSLALNTVPHLSWTLLGGSPEVCLVRTDTLSLVHFIPSLLKGNRCIGDG